MRKPIISLLSLFLISAYVTGQTDNRLSVEVQGGVGTYTTFTDFQEIVYTVEGRDFNRSYGNVAESDIVPYLSFGLNYELAERWQLAPFVHYLAGKGTHYENDYLLFGPSGVNPAQQIFDAPADYKIKALTVGAIGRYRLAAFKDNQLYVGTGVAYTYRSHFYRHEMDVDFGADYIAQRVDERFTTEKKSAVFIPVSAGLERALSDRLTLTLNVQGLISPETEDRAWSAGVGLRYGL